MSNKNEITVSEDYIDSLLNLFDKKYKKRILRYLYRSIRKRKNKVK